jgi:hypothetical protein
MLPVSIAIAAFLLVLTLAPRNRVIAAVLAACGAFWLPGLFVYQQKSAVFALLSYTFIGWAIRLGFLDGKK